MRSTLRPRRGREALHRPETAGALFLSAAGVGAVVDGAEKLGGGRKGGGLLAAFWENDGHGTAEHGWPGKA